MSIMKSYEISCDHCGNADHFMECSKKRAEELYSCLPTVGIIKDNKHFCDKDCHDNYLKKEQP